MQIRNSLFISILDTLWLAIKTTLITFMKCFLILRLNIKLRTRVYFYFSSFSIVGSSTPTVPASPRDN